jgi:hypothetical protein
VNSLSFPEVLGRIVGSHIYFGLHEQTIWWMGVNLSRSYLSVHTVNLIKVLKFLVNSLNYAFSGDEHSCFSGPVSWCVWSVELPLLCVVLMLTVVGPVWIFTVIVVVGDVVWWVHYPTLYCFDLCEVWILFIENVIGKKACVNHIVTLWLKKTAFVWEQLDEHIRGTQ